MDTFGTRYPTLAFISGGVGEAEDGIPPQPFETFCYDSALLQAKIENFNVIPYTSVLPKELYGNIVPVDKVVDKFHHGAVLEVIMAANGARIEEHRAIATGIGKEAGDSFQNFFYYGKTLGVYNTFWIAMLGQG